MRILIADDDPVARRMLESTLTRLGHEVEAVADGPDAINRLLDPDAPRMAILDWMMPGADGTVVCRVVRQRVSPYIYIILLTGKDRHEDMIAALDAGADDFLTKPFDAVELRARLRSAARVLEFQEGLLQAQEALRVQATSDELTGLANRRVILEQLDRELRRARHEKRPVAVAIADIDHFKAVNDRQGHSAGDAVLRHVSRCMKLELREYDSIGRQGGEEFLFVLPSCDTAAGCEAMERVRASIESTPAQWGGAPLPVTISVGVASTAPGGLTAIQLIEAADAAMYRAKENGRNRVEGEALPVAVPGDVEGRAAVLV